jgi:hypothetical protein
MSDMVRKQIYIHRRQEALLKRLARLRDTSEAEIIRHAIDLEAEHTQSFSAPSDPQAAWEDILRFVEERKKAGITGQPYRWNRQELYEEREGRWLRDRPQDEE